MCPISNPFFFFNDTATTEIYTLSLHDALPILADPDLAASVLPAPGTGFNIPAFLAAAGTVYMIAEAVSDRKSTRLNSSHGYISYAVFCLKKKRNTYASSIERRCAHEQHFIQST